MIEAAAVDPSIAVTTAYYTRVREILDWILANVNKFSNQNLKHALECVPFTQKYSRHLVFREDYRAAFQLFTALEIIKKSEFNGQLLKHFLTSQELLELDEERWFVVETDPLGRTNSRLMEVSTHCGWRLYFKDNTRNSTCNSGEFSCSKGEYKSYDEWCPDGMEGRHRINGKPYRTYAVLARTVDNPLFKDIEIPKSVQRYRNGPSVDMNCTLHVMGSSGEKHARVEDLSELILFIVLFFMTCIQLLQDITHPNS